jgi:hypothetical protein
MNYQKQAQDFATKYGVKLFINNVNYGKHFQDDKERRYIFNCTIKRNGKQYTFNFGQSIAQGDEEPTMYDILTCLEKYESVDFEDFCSNYGYDNDSIKALNTYKAVSREYKAVHRLFGDIMEELQEIN